MRDLSAGLGVIQFMFMAALVCFLVYFVSGVTAILLGVWVAFHLIWTLLAPRQPAAVPVPQMSAAAAAEAPAGTWAAPVVAAPTERTNWWGVAAASAVALSVIPFLAYDGSKPLVVALAGGGTIVAVIALRRSAPRSTLTSVAISVSVVAGAALTLLGLATSYFSQPTTLYGTPYGTEPGPGVIIEELNAELPCVDEPVTPAAAEQERWSFDPDGFTATMSCHISTAEDAQPVVFVQAATPTALDEVFAGGIILADYRFDNDVWVQRTGAVAVVTIDEDSADLAQAAGSTWISMNSYQPRERDR